METISARNVAITAFAPIAWGSIYFVTRQFLPLDTPLTGAAIRALPAGLILLMIARQLPRGGWWWKTPVISLLTVGGFFVLIYVAGARLPSSVAATLMATSAVVMLLMARMVLGERASVTAYGGAVLGVLGVVLLVGGAASELDPVGVAASVLAMLSASFGFVLTKRWRPPVSPLTFAAWQLTFGAMMIIPVALVVEGPPVGLDIRETFGFAYLVIIGTAMAYVAWFHGLSTLPAGTVGLIGLLNPLSGALLGAMAANESFTLTQSVGALAIVLGVAAGLRRRPPRDVCTIDAEKSIVGSVRAV